MVKHQGIYGHNLINFVNEVWTCERHMSGPFHKDLIVNHSQVNTPFNV